MSTKTIPQLTLRASLTDASMFEIDDGIQSYRITATQIVTYLQTKELISAAAMIASGVVTEVKLASDAVTTAKIAALAVTNAKMDDSYIHDLTAVTPVAADYVALADASDSNKKKKASVKLLRNAVYRAVSSYPDSIGTDDETLKLSGASGTLTLPTAAGVEGKRYKFIHAGTSLSQVYTIATTSSQTIGNVAGGSYKLCTNGEILGVESDGANWIIVQRYAESDWISCGSAINLYTFTITSGSCSGTIGATYTNNGNTYTLAQTFTTAATSIILRGPAAPSSSGTLTYVSGTHVGNPVFSAVSGSAYNVSGTTTTPTLHGGASTNTAGLRRSGKWAFYEMNFAWTTAGLDGSGDYIFTPNLSGLTIDTTQHPVFTGGNIQALNSESNAFVVAVFGEGSWGTANAANVNHWQLFSWVPYTSTSFRMYGEYNNTFGQYSIGSTYVGFGGANSAIKVVIKMAITEFQP